MVFGFSVNEQNLGTRVIPSARKRLNVIEQVSNPIKSPSFGQLDRDVFIKNRKSDLLFQDIPQMPKSVNNKFRELLDIFFERVPKNATSDGVEILKNKLLFNPDYKSEADLLKMLNLVKLFASQKTPKGDFILRGSDVFYLADYKNNGVGNKKMQEVLDLIECAKESRITVNSLRENHPGNKSSVIHSFSEINPLMQKDINKLKYAQSRGIDPIDVFIPKYDSIIKDGDKALEKLPIGELVSFNHGYNGEPATYVKLGENRIHPLNIDRETLFDLMPPVKRFFIQQGQSGTCYQLAAYNSLMSNPKFFADMLSRIQVKNGEYIVKMPHNSTTNSIFAGKFPDIDKYGSVLTPLKNGEFIPSDKSKSARSNPLIKALENLYGKHRKYTLAQQYVKQVQQSGGNEKLAFKEACDNMDSCIYVKTKNGQLVRTTLKDINNNILSKDKNGRTFSTVEDYYKESGTIDEIFKFFMKNKIGAIETYSTEGKTNKVNLTELRRILSYDDAAKTFSNINRTLPQKDLYTNHAYSVVGYDEKTDIVKYVNPWNTSLVYEMKLTDLMPYIHSISACARK